MIAVDRRKAEHQEKVEIECPVCGMKAERVRRAKYCSPRCKKRGESQRLTKAHRLAIASAVAPSLRRARKPRLITTLDAEGKPVRTITDVELASSILKRADIELSTDAVGGQRSCEECKGLFVAKAANAKRCDVCRFGRCSDCAKPRKHRAKVGRDSGRCHDCALTLRRASKATRFPCPRCRAELWTKHGRARKRCLGCGHRTKPAGTGLPCVDCTRLVAGHRRKGRCMGCYMRSRYTACQDCGAPDRGLSTKGLCQPCGATRQARAVEACKLHPHRNSVGRLNARGRPLSREAPSENGAVTSGGSA